ncbi:MAG TPA: hypothetical protein VGM53_03145 [Streptosporangiaceae bacterium]|jgi:hypothetical protein
MKFALSKATAAGAAAVAALALTAAPAAQASAIYVKSGDYQFASNYTDGSSSPFLVSNSPFSYSDASQKIASNGVDLSVGGSPNYASSAVIVDLGKLDTLFSNGQFVPPAITGSSNLAYNLYFDVNGDGTYFGWGSHDPYVFTSENGDAAASMENGSDGQADFTTFSGEAGAGNSALDSTPYPDGLSGVMTMTDVQKAFEARTDDGTTDPEVWAWIGIQTSPDASGYVTSIDGTPLVSQVPAVNPVSGLKATAKYTNATATWKASKGATSYKVTVTTHKGTVTVKTATVTGTSYTAGHLKEKTSYAVHVLAQPAASGAKPATVYVTTK